MKLTELSTEDELLTRYEAQRAFAAAQIEEHREKIEAFKTFSASKGLSLTNESFSYVPTIGIVASAPAIFRHLTGGIAQERRNKMGSDPISSAIPSGAAQLTG